MTLLTTTVHAGRTTVVALLAILLSGCTAPSIAPAPDVVPPSLASEWDWTVPEGGSGTFEARIDVHPGNGAAVLTTSFDMEGPNRNGELLYVEAYWTSSMPGEHLFAIWWFLPASSYEVLVRAAGTNLAGPVSAPGSPIVVPNGGELPFDLKLPKGNRKDTLVITGIATRDASQTNPLSVAFRVDADERRLHPNPPAFHPGAAAGRYLSTGGFDGSGSTRIQLGPASVAATTASVDVLTEATTLILVNARIEGDQHGVGEIKVTISGTEGTSDYQVGGVDGGSTLVAFFRRPYGDAWTVDVDFTGEGYVSLTYGNPATHAKLP